MDTGDPELAMDDTAADPLAADPSSSSWTGLAPTWQAHQEAALAEGEKIRQTTLPLAFTPEEQALRSLTQDPAVARPFPLTTHDPPGIDPVQVVVPYYEEWRRAGYLFGHYRESQLHDGSIPIRTTTGAIPRTNLRRTMPSYLAKDRDETDWPQLFHPAVLTTVREAMETMCPPLAAELLCLPPTATRETYRLYGMDPAVHAQVGDCHLGHFYQGNSATDEELIPLALGTDIVGDLVHMGACRGFRKILSSLQRSDDWVWELIRSLPLYRSVFSPQHAVVKVLAWCRYIVALAVYGVDNFVRTVGDSQTQLCPELCYPPAPTDAEVQIFHFWAWSVIGSDSVVYPDAASRTPPSWTEVDSSNWKFRLVCNAIPTIDAVWEAWFTSPRQQFFMANVINVAPENVLSWNTRGCQPLNPNELWCISTYRRSTASLARLLPLRVLQGDGSTAPPLTDAHPSIFRTPPGIARPRDYADYLPEGPLRESPLASPTWPMSPAALRRVIARIRQPFDP